MPFKREMVKIFTQENFMPALFLKLHDIMVNAYVYKTKGEEKAVY